MVTHFLDWNVVLLKEVVKMNRVNVCVCVVEDEHKRGGGDGSLVGF